MMYQGLFAGGFFAFFGIMMLVGIAVTIFWIWMLVDCAKRNFKKSDDKVVWILVIALASWVGALIYYFVVKKKQD